MYVKLSKTFFTILTFSLNKHINISIRLDRLHAYFWQLRLQNLHTFSLSGYLLNRNMPLQAKCIVRELHSNHISYVFRPKNQLPFVAYSWL